jgi:putative ATP-dependent endonuclease of the OLD family
VKIKSLEVKNFRSIRNQKIQNTSKGLILVGKNNSGKSALLNSLRAFFGQYSIQEEDFHRNNTEIEINIEFELDNEYIKNCLFDSKIGWEKVPSSATEFNKSKIDTRYSEANFNNYKDIRNTIFSLPLNDIEEQHNDAINIWVSAIKERYGIENSDWEVKLKVDKLSLKYEYFNKDGISIKDVDRILPLMAFIDDDRNFSEEENGKAKTITNDLFGNHIINKNRAVAICPHC